MVYLKKKSKCFFMVTVILHHRICWPSPPLECAAFSLSLPLLPGSRPLLPSATAAPAPGQPHVLPGHCSLSEPPSRAAIGAPPLGSATTTMGSPMSPPRPPEPAMPPPRLEAEQRVATVAPLCSLLCPIAHGRLLLSSRRCQAVPRSSSAPRHRNKAEGHCHRRQGSPAGAASAPELLPI